ncbi:hypothetical protein PINS_up001994 [Pythium insidiosum]|nr:hypothetical protein PINS_up001994 [Pythium insidiosum]
MTKGSEQAETKRSGLNAIGENISGRRAVETHAKESVRSLAAEQDHSELQDVLTLQTDEIRENEPARSLIMHDGNNASIVTEEVVSPNMPWTPRSLVRAKTAIIYKHTLNDTLLVLERNIFFFNEWTSYFVSLQEDHLLLFKSREKWEQGLKPDKVVALHASVMLGEMKVEVVGSDSSRVVQDGPAPMRLFRRKLVETDELDQWINGELRQSSAGDSGSSLDSVFLKNPNASARCVLEFGAYNQNTFELWSKTIRRVLQLKRDSLVGQKKRSARSDSDDVTDNNAAPSPLRASGQSAPRSWVSPGHDSKLTLHQSEIWCHRVLSGEKEKAESELRRIIAMEKLVSQVTNPRMALLVYEKVSRVHELFIANSRREIERLDGRDRPISAEVLNFFADHLKRKYSVFSSLHWRMALVKSRSAPLTKRCARKTRRSTRESVGVSGNSNGQHLHTDLRMLKVSNCMRSTEMQQRTISA